MTRAGQSGRRRRAKARLRWLALLAWICASWPTADADTVMRYVYHPSAVTGGANARFEWEVLESALRATRQALGTYQLVAAEAMSEERQAHELAAGTGRLTVMYADATPERERSLLPVRIPVYRNLGGYGIFLIRKSDQATFDRISRLEDLRRLRFGAQAGSVDASVLLANGVQVVTGSSRDGLFQMLVNGRFDVLRLGAHEIMAEYAQRSRDLPGLAIERRLVLYYPKPMYFWFSRSAEGRALAARVEAGLRRMSADGSYDRIFARYHDDAIRQLDLKHRMILRIPNPDLGAETPLNDASLWFDPATYRPAR